MHIFTIFVTSIFFFIYRIRNYIQLLCEERSDMADSCFASTSFHETFPDKFVDSQRSNACLKGLCRLYEQSALCDVTLVVVGQQFLCHRAVLAASSVYFHTMFTSNFLERTSAEVVMNEIDAHCIKAVLAYLYRGEVRFIMYIESLGKAAKVGFITDILLFNNIL